MYDKVKSHVQNADIWSGDYRWVLKQLQGVVVSEVQRVASNVLSALHHMGKKYVSVVDAKSEGSALVIESIANYTREGVIRLTYLFDLQGEKLAQTYHDAIHVFAQSARTADDLDNPLLLPLYSIKTDFIRDCSAGFDVIQSAIDANKDNIRRVHETFNTEPANIPNVPKGLMPVIAPFVQAHFFNDFVEMNKKNDVRNFTQHIVATTIDLELELSNVMYSQIVAAGDVLDVALNTTTKLTHDVKRALMDKIRLKQSSCENDINDMTAKALDDLRINIPQYYDEPKNAPHWELSTICQENIDEYARKMNEIAGKAINDIVNLFQLINDM